MNRTLPSATRFLHVANGTCTTRLIESAGIPGMVSIWADPLYEGPVPGGLTDSELVDLRAYFLAGPSGEDVSGVNDLRQWRAAIGREGSWDELVLWFEHDLFDQLNLIQLLTWIRTHLSADKVVSLVCVGSFPGHPTFMGLGELTPEELASLFDTRQQVGEAEYTLAEVAWRAFCDPTPKGLDALRRSDTTALPYLAAAVARFLQEYPWTTDGLGRTERRLMEVANAGIGDLATAFPYMHEGEQFYYVTDASLVALAETLASTAPPLLAVAGDRREDSERLHKSIALTAAGRAVLAGRQDRVATCGIDRWLGGVRLHGDAATWRWDNEHDCITRS